MAQELLVRDPDGAQVARLDDLAAAARSAAGQVVDAARAWTEQLGPFYDTEGVRHLLAGRNGPVSRQAVSKRRGLLALTTGSGRVVYPRFQFRDGAPLPGLDRVLAELPESLVSRWTVASRPGWSAQVRSSRGRARSTWPLEVPLSTPPAALPDFPTVAGADRRQRLFRIYRLRDPVSGQVRSPWFFAAVPPGAGRFDLPVPRGTCYWTDHGYAAWLEVFRGTGLVDRADVDARQMAVASPPPLRLADLRAPAARRYGVTAEVSTTDDYQLGQRWAAAIAAAGFAGLRAVVRHDPTLRAASVAVFGPAGARTRMAGWTLTRGRLDADAEPIADLAAFGTGIAPRPFDVPVIARTAASSRELRSEAAGRLQSVTGRRLKIRCRRG